MCLASSAPIKVTDTETFTVCARQTLCGSDHPGNGCSCFTEYECFTIESERMGSAGLIRESFSFKEVSLFS